MKRLLQGLFQIMSCTIFFLILRLLSLIPPLYKYCVSKMDKETGMDLTPLSQDDYMWTLGSWECIRSIYSKAFSDIVHGSGVSAGEVLHNSKLLRFEDGSECRLLDFKRVGRPLVLNFGSCS